MRNNISFGDIFKVNEDRMRLVKVDYEGKKMIGFCSLKDFEVKYLKEEEDINEYLKRASFEWKDEQEKIGITIHLFECTHCDIGDFTSDEWNEASKENLEGFEELLYEPIEECKDLKKRYVCPGCYQEVKLGDCIHSTIEK